MRRADAIAYVESLGFETDPKRREVWRLGPVTLRWCAPHWYADHAWLAWSQKTVGRTPRVALSRLRSHILELAEDVPLPTESDS